MRVKHRTNSVSIRLNCRLVENYIGCCESRKVFGCSIVRPFGSIDNSCARYVNKEQLQVQLGVSDMVVFQQYGRG
jgi:hypothetical protein